MINKRKIVNDPVYGFINIPYAILYDLIEHPYFQRLRRIQQLGLTNYVYPGANHTRFQHALGAVHLMEQAIAVLRSKNQEITEDEAEGVMIAILLHDIGHGPFSHALESSIVPDVSHEKMSLLFMLELNRQFDERLSLAIEIFRNQYHKKFLNQLVSSQLDMDRLDYLRRDSFFTGVTEGAVGSDRIIKMLTVVNDELVVEEKGIYSIEKFLVARRLMYWQVYFHKTVMSAERLLVNTLRRVQQLSANGEKVFSTPYLGFFLNKELNVSKYINSNDADERKVLLDNFAKLDDNDIIVSAKVWAEHSDKTLSVLSQNLTARKLSRIEVQYEQFSGEIVDYYRNKVNDVLGISRDDVDYFVFTGEISNNTYTTSDDRIKILMKSGDIKDITEASDMLDQSVLAKTVVKHFLCYPKEVRL
ncbi:MAG: HD domain-containing protein [Bacteroidota bacterium]|nr:HD domain-containing protein [Bacteroidota bacterium]